MISKVKSSILDQAKNKLNNSNLNNDARLDNFNHYILKYDPRS
jgi:hypothetical protein